MRSLIKPRVVVDTNVFVSGALFRGNPGIILNQINNRAIELIMSAELEAETLRTLARLQVPADIYQGIQYTLEHHVVRMLPKAIPPVSRDPNDDMLLALSLAGEADYLITGDKDLLILRRFGKTQIVTPKQFLREKKI